MPTIDEMLEVYVDDEGLVCIAHRDMTEDRYVAFSPEQTEALIRLLREKKREAIDFIHHHAAGA